MTSRIPHKQPAGVATRLIAAALDAVVVLAIVLIGYGVVAAVSFIVNPLRFSFPRPARWLTIGTALASAAGYLAVAWTRTGRTYGASVMGLRVIRSDGRRLRLAGALARSVLCMAFPIGLLWCAASARNRSLQDLLLRTSVIYDWHDADSAPHSSGMKRERGAGAIVQSRESTNGYRAEATDPRRARVRPRAGIVGLRRIRQ